MRTNRLVPFLVAAAAIASASTGGAFAVCGELGGFAIFGCGDFAYVAPPPTGATFDPNNRVTNITTVYWQLGFGNADLNSGAGSSGSGNSGPSTFNGNDSGLAKVDVGNARTITGNTSIPTGALCLVNNNWGNANIDGCADNERGTSISPSNDDILNPLYQVYYSRNGSPGYYSNAWVQDYPMAFLMKTQNARWFAIAAVASLDRASTGTGNGPCAGVPGTNPAACDYRVGSYSFKAVNNGGTNTATGLKNVIPWQEVPRPKPACVAGCIGAAIRTVNFSWNPATWYHDNSIRPTSHPNMGGAGCPDNACPGAPGTSDPTRAPGVGVKDLLRAQAASSNWRGLIRYDLERAFVTASNLDPNGRVNFATLAWATDANQPVTIDIPQPALDPNTGNPVAGSVVQVSGVQVASDTCWRVAVKFGKKPETTATGTANCRLGKCGDKGYVAASNDQNVITCVGGALFSESFTGAVATRGKGEIVVQWSVGSEISMTGYNIYVLNSKGARNKINSEMIPCTECTSGVLTSYEYRFPLSAAKGARAVVVEALASTTFETAPLPIGH